ncbi:hypothetical protein Q9966_000425 [Columba livia]|nr:hypothetical protein Q9966_000425 [Columba livia]
MTMYKTIPTFILLFTGCLHTNMNVAADTPPPGSSLPTAETTQAPELETPPHENNAVPEERLSSLIVAGISMTVVFLFILVIIGACYVWKKSKGSLVENNSDPSGEPGVALKDFQHLKTNTSGLLEAHYADSGSAVA